MCKYNPAGVGLMLTYSTFRRVPPLCWMRSMIIDRLSTYLNMSETLDLSTRPSLGSPREHVVVNVYSYGSPRAMGSRRAFRELRTAPCSQASGGRANVAAVWLAYPSMI